MTHCHNCFQIPRLTQVKGWGFSVGFTTQEPGDPEEPQLCFFKNHTAQESLAHRVRRRTLPHPQTHSWNTDKPEAVIDKEIRRWADHILEYFVPKFPVVVSDIKKKVLVLRNSCDDVPCTSATSLLKALNYKPRGHTSYRLLQYRGKHQEGARWLSHKFWKFLSQTKSGRNY